MINISRTNNNLVITNDSNYGFPFQDGQLVIPVNSIIYTLETESDYITFRSSANNDVLFSGTLGDITIDGTVATRDDFIDSFNAIAYASVGSGSGSGSSVTVDSTLSTTSTNPVQNKVIAAKVNEISNSLPKSGNGTTVENGVVNISTIAACMPFGQDNAYALRSTHPEYGIGRTLYSIEGDDTIAFSVKGSNGQWGEFAQISVNTDVVALKSDIPEIKEWVGTQAEYDALTTYDADTTYYIIEEE